jgi:hypothetical protein
MLGMAVGLGQRKCGEFVRASKKGERKGKATRLMSVEELNAKRAVVLEALRNGKTLKAAAKAAGYGFVWLWEQRRADPEFAAACEEAIQQGTDVLEDVLLACATKATNSPKHQTALIFALKNRRPHKWRDRQELGVDGGLDLRSMASTPEEELMRIAYASRVIDVQALPLLPAPTSATELPHE